VENGSQDEDPGGWRLETTGAWLDIALDGSRLMQLMDVAFVC